VLTNVFRLSNPRLSGYEILTKDDSKDAEIVKLSMGKDFDYLNNLMSVLINFYKFMVT
jgi:hypothetical protein